MNTNDIHITLPHSKSISNRWLVLSHFFPGMFQLSGLSRSDDTALLRRLLLQLEQGGSSVFYCGNAGTVARFMTAVLAFTPGTYLITGDERLSVRPIADLVEALNGMGAHISYTRDEGRLPLQILGTAPSRKMAKVNASQSSQFVSALLLVAPSLSNGISLTLTSHAASRPYIRMTCDILSQAGFTVKTNATGRTISVGSAVDCPPRRQMVSIERDWTSASYFYEMAALDPSKRLRLVGLSLRSLQGDAVLPQIFESLGVSTTSVRSPYHSGVTSIRIQGGGPLPETFRYSFRDCPDLAPSVVVAAAALGVRSVFSGLNTLRLKESDRLQALIEQLSLMGADISLHADQTLHIRPAKLQPSCPVETYGDHRLAMAFSPLRILFPDIEILHPDLVTKSYPDFWDNFNLVFSDHE